MLHKPKWTIVIIPILIMTLYICITYLHDSIGQFHLVDNCKVDLIQSHDELPPWDFTRLINLTNFQFHILNKVCTKKSKLLILIHTAPSNVDKRQAIRETWGRHDLNGVHVMFVFGAVDTQEKQNMIQNEDEKYRDIVQGSFKDTYRNLLYKHMTGFKYALYYCPELQYIIKTDDDCYIDIPAALEYIKFRENNCPYKDFIQCKVSYRSQVLRAKNSKWYVPFEEYPLTHYPDYCIGSIPVVYSMSAVNKLYREMQKGEYFWVEDVHVTGTIAKRLNIPRFEIDNYCIKSISEKIISTAAESNKKMLFNNMQISSSDMRTLFKIFNKLKPNSNMYFDKKECL